jgi:hypothetical protein
MQGIEHLIELALKGLFSRNDLYFLRKLEELLEDL